MLRDIAAEVNQAGKALFTKFIQDGLRVAAFEIYGINSYYSRKTGATCFSHSLREAQLLATTHPVAGRR